MSRNHTCTNPHLKDVVQVSDDGALWEVIDLWSCLWAWIWRKGVIDKLNFTVPRYENNEISPEICYLEISLPLYILQIPHQAQCSTVNLPLISVNKLKTLLSSEQKLLSSETHPERKRTQKIMAAIVIYQIIQHNEAASKSHDIYSRINSSQQAIKMLALSSAALFAPLHTSSLHNDWLHSILHHISTLQESLISNMSPFILKHQRFVTETWRIYLQRNGSGQIDFNLLNLALWKTCHYIHLCKTKNAYMQIPVVSN